jgi:hypothetical protein
VDGRPQTTLLWGLAAGLRKKHAGLTVIPASAAAILAAALSPLAASEPWGLENDSVVSPLVSGSE